MKKNKRDRQGRAIPWEKTRSGLLKTYYVNREDYRKKYITIMQAWTAHTTAQSVGARGTGKTYMNYKNFLSAKSSELQAGVLGAERARIFSLESLVLF